MRSLKMRMMLMRNTRRELTKLASLLLTSQAGWLDYCFFGGFLEAVEVGDGFGFGVALFWGFELADGFGFAQFF